MSRLSSQLEKDGYRLVPAGPDVLSAMIHDLEAEDKLEAESFARIAGRDWSDMITESFEHTHVLHAIGTDAHEGYLVYGVAEMGHLIGRIWMVQSQSFFDGAQATKAEAAPHMVVGWAHKAIADELDRYNTLCNFIPGWSERNLRFIQACGYKVFDDPYYDSDWKFFSIGKYTEQLAKDRALWNSFINREKPAG